MSKKWLMVVLVFLIPSGVMGQTAPPTDAQIDEWCKAECREAPDEEIKVYDRQVEIVLTGKETAFLVSVDFPDRGRNSYSGAILARPKLKEARQIEEVGEDFEVVSDNDAPPLEPSVISTATLGSGGGTTAGVKSLLYFDGWKPVILHETRFGDDQGNCGVYTACLAQEVQWFFTDVDGDRRKDLIEVIIQKYGGSKKLRWVAKTNVYLRKGNKFVAASPSMSMDPGLLKAIFGK